MGVWRSKPRHWLGGIFAPTEAGWRQRQILAFGLILVALAVPVGWFLVVFPDLHIPGTGDLKYEWTKQGVVYDATEAQLIRSRWEWLSWASFFLNLGCLLLGLVLVTADVVKWRRTPFTVKVTTQFRWVLREHLPSFLIGIVATALLVFYPLYLQNWLYPKLFNSAQLMLDYEFLVFGFTFFLLWAVPAFLSVSGFREICGHQLRQSISNKIRAAKGHTVFVGFGDLANRVVLDQRRGGDRLVPRPVLLSDGSMQLIFNDCVVLDSREALFSYMFTDHSGDKVGLIKAPAATQREARTSRDKHLRNTYFIGVVGDARFQHHLEKVRIRQARTVISTVIDEQAAFTVFDACRAAKKAGE